MRAGLIIAFVAVLLLGVLLLPGAHTRGRPLSGRAKRIRRAFAAAAVICLVIDLFAIASGGVSGLGDALQLLALTVLPFIYLYWRFGGSFKFRRE